MSLIAPKDTRDLSRDILFSESHIGVERKLSEVVARLTWEYSLVQKFFLRPELPCVGRTFAISAITLTYAILKQQSKVRQYHAFSNYRPSFRHARCASFFPHKSFALINSFNLNDRIGEKSCFVSSFRNRKRKRFRIREDDVVEEQSVVCLSAMSDRTRVDDEFSSSQPLAESSVDTDDSSAQGGDSAAATPLGQSQRVTRAQERKSEADALGDGSGVFEEAMRTQHQ